MILKLFLITFIVVSIVDISGIIQSLQKGLARLFNVKWYQINLPLISCSYCMNWWLSLLYIYIHNCFTIPYIALILLLSGLTPIFKELFYTISDLLLKILNLLR